MKSEFLQLWDGMLSEDIDNKYGVVVVGATYRLLAIIHSLAIVLGILIRLSFVDCLVLS